MDGEERPSVLRLSVRLVVIAGGAVVADLGRVCVVERLALLVETKVGRFGGVSSGG